MKLESKFYFLKKYFNHPLIQEMIHRISLASLKKNFQEEKEDEDYEEELNKQKFRF